jgi:hypothetical protein
MINRPLAYLVDLNSFELNPLYDQKYMINQKEFYLTSKMIFIIKNQLYCKFDYGKKFIHKTMIPIDFNIYPLPPSKVFKDPILFVIDLIRTIPSKYLILLIRKFLKIMIIISYYYFISHLPENTIQSLFEEEYSQVESKNL